jgi:hypothetical protein
MIEIFNSKMLIIILLLLLLIYLNIQLKNNNIENMTISIRKMEDYYTTATDAKQKILELNYTINNKKYKLGFVNKNKFNQNCKICDKTDLGDIYPVLVNSTLITKKNCENDELVKCYNDNTIADCKTNAMTVCYNNKLPSSSSEIMIYNVEEKKIDEKNNILEPSYILRTGDDKTNVLSLDSIEVEIKNTKQIRYFVCCNKISVAIPEDKKHLHYFYLEQDTENTDKIKFKIYFMLKTQPMEAPKKLYLGYMLNDMCENIVCKTEECIDDFKFLTLYDDPKNANIISFEPELLRFD